MTRLQRFVRHIGVPVESSGQAVRNVLPCIPNTRFIAHSIPGIYFPIGSFGICAGFQAPERWRTASAIPERRSPAIR